MNLSDKGVGDAAAMTTHISRRHDSVCSRNGGNEVSVDEVEVRYSVDEQLNGFKSIIPAAGVEKRSVGHLDSKKLLKRQLRT